jgi:hypothetical protein
MTLRLDPHQGLAELPLAQRSCHVTLQQETADPPGMKTARVKGQLGDGVGGDRRTCSFPF